MTIPNIISIFRIMLALAFCVFYFIPGMRPFAFAVLVLSGISDVADGYIARKFNQISNLGKILDPIADKLFHFSTIICFWLTEVIDLWLVVLYFAKELFMAICGLIFYKKNRVVIAARWYGKVASSLFFLTFILVFFFSWTNLLDLAVYKILITGLFALSLGMSFFAAARYFVTAIKINNNNIQRNLISIEEDKNNREVI